MTQRPILTTLPPCLQHKKEKEAFNKTELRTVTIQNNVKFKVFHFITTGRTNAKTGYVMIFAYIYYNRAR